MANNIHFLLGSPQTNMTGLKGQLGTFYLTSYDSTNQDSNRLFIGTSDAVGGVLPIVAPTPYHLTLKMNNVNELVEYNGSANVTTNLIINNDGVYQNGSQHAAVHYALCQTAAGTAAKTTTITGYHLIAGARVHIKFLNTNTASNPTLNISSTGAKSINFNNKISKLIANVIYTFIYDGTNYVLLDENHIIGNYAEIFNDSSNSATGSYSHAEGQGTIASGAVQHVQGKYNIADTTSALIIGNGTSTTRSNAYKIDFSGNSVQAGRLTAVGATLSDNLLILNAETSPKNQPYIQWATMSSNTPYTGFAHDQNDGTFIIISMEKDTATYGVKNYRNGLSIGGGSGNLFWKGDRVVTGSAATLGSATKPVYLSEGRLYACNDTLDVGISGVAAKATILETARTVLIDLASTTAASFNGSANITPGVSGTLPIANGGTGATTATGVLTNLGITATAAELNILDGATITISGNTITGNLTGTATNATNAVNATTATNANNLYINNTAADTKYYIIGSASQAAGNSALYRAYNTSGTANTTGVYFNGASGVLYGAAWNDYAEFRKTEENIEAGRVVCETGKGDLTLSTERLQPGAEVVSDTFGFAIGESNECKTPIAVSGRVLAYPYEKKEYFKAGDAVCAGPNGTVSKMTREEIINYPDRIIGTVSEIPEYEIWGETGVKVNNRIWIRIR